MTRNRVERLISIGGQYRLKLISQSESLGHGIGSRPMLNYIIFLSTVCFFFSKFLKPTISAFIVEGQPKPERKIPRPEILDHLPYGKLVVLEDCGHILQYGAA